MYRTSSLFTSVCLLLLIMLGTTNAHATFNKNLWPAWEAHNPLSTQTIDHSEWQQFLDKYVVTDEEGINLVDYAHTTPQGYALLTNYIEKMSKIDINSFNRDEQFAFWINLYNALTVKIIADYYPIGSIEEINISPGLFSVGPWGAKIVTVNHTSLSLDEIHNRIIRPIWNDPRTHYAINNGSIGAANLQKQVYEGRLINQQLNKAAADYINSLRGAQVIEGKLTLSKIYEWFCDDFGGTGQNIINHIKYFAREPLSSQLKHVNTVENHVYNWHLNSTIPNKS
ncbi:putative Ser/Thr protein kinase [Legionella spiritensis]|uniref:Putative Ser/Thr protein kinase n=2 Tax=Legionella spiritensis TaxID=452 RepID=A0A0W0Z120_LEGSP|nr:putative Ser/Thr protein kinase [Legionella spiritensis]SNV30869.1 putative Ser/Thr protein kinase [Legionella spiritensis]